ncbi:phage tail assembly protein [Novosphingobium huizhouense]|uniref:phage tail assembly protein n=1 Tax=Novosphingobium huizhouense TaxID=2866625 RepID=UPI001CD8A3A1|nr:phage tail assembly protein [Novosphingobium huizhouense]
MSDTTAAPVAATTTETVTLNAPIERQEGPAVAALSLRKPKAGDLRGLNIQSLMTGDVASVITLLPRIAQPYITAHEAAALEAEDIAEVAGTIMGFFMTASQKAAIRQALGG